MIFYFNHFSFIIFYHSIFGLRLQGHSAGYSLRSRARDMTITIVIINPQQEMGWIVDDVMPRRDGLRIWGFKKITAVEDLRLDHASRQLSSLPLSWVSDRCGGDKVFRGPTSEDELRFKTPRDVPNVMSVDSIVWLRKTFKNCLSPRVKKPKSEVNKTVRIWTTESACICIYIRVVYNILVSLEFEEYGICFPYHYS